MASPLLALPLGRQPPLRGTAPTPALTQLACYPPCPTPACPGRFVSFCSPSARACKDLAGSWEELGRELLQRQPAPIFLTTVDPHSAPALARRFAISTLPTLLLFRDRKVGAVLHWCCGGWCRMQGQVGECCRCVRLGAVRSMCCGCTACHGQPATDTSGGPLDALMLPCPAPPAPPPCRCTASPASSPPTLMPRGCCVGLQVGGCAVHAVLSGCVAGLHAACAGGAWCSRPRLQGERVVPLGTHPHTANFAAW